MKYLILSVGLLLLTIAIASVTMIILASVSGAMSNTPFKFVILFIVLILSSNILAKVSLKYINL